MDNQVDNSLSSLWRSNASKDAGTDLASVIDAARVIAQSLIPGSDVTFQGVKTAATDQKKIELPAIDVSQHPIPGDKVDRLLGVTVHKIGHILFPDADKPAVLSRLGYYGLTGLERDFISSLIDVFGDVFIDHVMTAYPGYHDYLKRERAASLAEYDIDTLVKPLMGECDRTDMLNALVYLALYGGQLPTAITQKNLDTLTKLFNISMQMISKQIKKDQAVINAWTILKQLPAFIDHNQDGTMANPDSEASQDSGQSPPTDQASETKSGDESKGDASGQEPPEESKPEPGETEPEQKPEPEPESDDEEPEDGEPTNESTEEVSGEKTETPESNNSADEPTGDESGDGDSEEPTEPEDGEPEPADGTEPAEPEPGDSDIVPEPAKFEPVNLAAHLDDAVDNSASLDQQTAAAVSQAVVEKRSDLSQLVSYLANKSDSTILTFTPDEGAPIVAEARADTAEAEEKTRRVFQEYRLRRTRDYRGSMSGRVSNRRLYRVSYGDQRVFQRRERPEEIDMVVALLMDLSRSTRGFRGLIYQIVCTLADALTKERVEFIGLGYSGDATIYRDANTVQIPRLYDKESGKVKLDIDGISGSTPSYEGLAAGIAELLRLGGTRKKILFHFTDGEPNGSMSDQIPVLLKQSREKGIIDIHICLSNDGELGDTFKSLYGENAFGINDINRLPEIIDQMLKERLEGLV